MKFEIKNRWTGNVQFECELSAEFEAVGYGVQLGAAIKIAYERGADLRGADMSGADMSGADLRGADMSGAVLRGADMSGAVLHGADLRGADMSGADMSGADMSDADMSDADMSGADLRDADMSDAVLRGAVLSGADLSGAVLSGADMRFFKADLWMTLSQNRNEIPGLIAALKEGRIDGSTYEGDCACLVGTIANEKHVSVEVLEKNSNNPAEQWFLMIRKGDMPGDESGGGFAAQKALEWALEYCALTGIEITEAT